MKRLALIALLLAAACNRSETTQQAVAPDAPAGAARGQQLITMYGCNVCHTVPGITGPQGTLAPTLAGIASRPRISNGTVENTPENLVKFIQNPASLNPQSAMPPIGLPPGEAENIAAYLMTLR